MHNSIVKSAHPFSSELRHAAIDRAVANTRSDLEILPGIDEEPEPLFEAMTSSKPAPARVSSSPLPVGVQVADLCALQNYLSEVLAIQQAEPEMRKTLAAHSIVARSLEVVRKNTDELRAVVAAQPDGRKNLRARAANLSDLFLRFISKMRPRDLPRMVRSDYALLKLTMMNYSKLHSGAAALRQAATVNLAIRHFRQLHPLVQQLTRLMPSILGRALWGNSLSEVHLANLTAHQAALPLADSGSAI